MTGRRHSPSHQTFSQSRQPVSAGNRRVGNTRRRRTRPDLDQMKVARLRSRSDSHEIGGVGGRGTAARVDKPCTFPHRGRRRGNPPARHRRTAEQRRCPDPGTRPPPPLPWDSPSQRRSRLLRTGLRQRFTCPSLRTHDKLDHRPQVVGHFQSSAPQPASVSIASTIG